MEKGIKTLVFAHHRGILDAIADKLSKKKIKHIRIDGGTVRSSLVWSTLPAFPVCVCVCVCVCACVCAWRVVCVCVWRVVCACV